MFYGKRIKEIEERLAKAEQFEKCVCTVIDNYFATNEKKDLKFSTDCVFDKFYHFVMSVDEKLKALSKVDEENAVLKDEIAKEFKTHQAFVETAKKKVDEQQAIINAQAKESEALAKAKKSTAKGGKK
jgi:hypothetical protein